MLIKSSCEFITLAIPEVIHITYTEKSLKTETSSRMIETTLNIYSDITMRPKDADGITNSRDNHSMLWICNDPKSPEINKHVLKDTNGDVTFCRLCGGENRST